VPWHLPSDEGAIQLSPNPSLYSFTGYSGSESGAARHGGLDIAPWNGTNGGFKVLRREIECADDSVCPKSIPAEARFCSHAGGVIWLHREPDGRSAMKNPVLKGQKAACD
jgi:hypothetical protein